jgi:hypothetical protein
MNIIVYPVKSANMVIAFMGRAYRDKASITKVVRAKGAGETRCTLIHGMETLSSGQSRSLPSGLNIGQTKRLLLAALRLWELKNGYRR